jgi:hypothetical protein
MAGDPGAPPADVARWLRTIAALDLGSDLEPPRRPLTDARWRAVLDEARRRRLVGRLSRSIAAGDWSATDQQAEQAATAHRRIAARDLLLERQLLATVAGLRAAGIRPLALKGPVLAHLVYATPADRSFRDVDLLVPAAQMDLAVSTLETSGARRHYPEPRPGFDAHYSKGVAFTAPSGYEVDLHRSLALPPYGLLVEPSDLFVHTTTVEIGAVAVECPDLTGLTAHAALHAVLGDPWPRWENLRDVATLLHHVDVAVAPVVGLVTRWQAQAVLACAIGAAWTELALDRTHPAFAWAAGRRPDRADVTRLQAYHGDQRDHARGALAGAGAIPDWRDRARYLRGIALPDAAVRSHPQRWRRGWRALRAVR